MSRSAKIILDWADGTYPFALKVEHLAELQDCTGAGPWYIRWALEAAVLAPAMQAAPPKDMSAAYVVDTLRLGLIGGGMAQVDALKKVRAHVGPGWLDENIAAAYAVISAALTGVEEDAPGKAGAGAKTNANRSRAAGSGSRKSTGPAPPSD